MIRLACPGCRAPIPAADVHLESRAARCRACDAVFAFQLPSAAVEAEVAPPTSLPGPVREPSPGSLVGRHPAEPRRLPQPPGIERTRTGKGVLFERSWFHWGLIPLIAFTIAWDSFLVMWYSISFAQSQWFMALFSVAHLAAGIGMTYGCLTGLLNTTRVRVEGGRLTVTHGPIPYPGTLDLDVREIEQLYAKCLVTQSDDSTRETYELRALLRDRRHLTLLEGLTDSAQALFLEMELEDHLGIPDQPVEGELARTAGGGGEPGPRRGLPSRGTGGEVEADPAPAALEGAELRELPDAACPVCREPAGREPQRCPGCGVPHHPECWRYNGGCATYGCARAPRA